MSPEYAYNHLQILPITSVNRGEYPAYPSPWHLVIDDCRVILGDGRTADDAKNDSSSRGISNIPSPQALSTLLSRARKKAKGRKRRAHSARAQGFINAQTSEEETRSASAPHDN